MELQAPNKSRLAREEPLVLTIEINDYKRMAMSWNEMPANIVQAVTSCITALRIALRQPCAEVP